MRASRIDRVRSQVPVTERLSYLNTGSVGPLPIVANDAIADAIQREVEEGRIGSSAAELRDSFSSRTRSGFSDVINASPSAVALTHSTGEGMNIALWSLDWKPGDEVLTTNIEHSAAAIPLDILARRWGIVTKEVDLGLGQMDAVAAFAEQIGPKSRTIVISHLSHSTGATLPVIEIGNLARQHGLIYVVDGAQAVGAIPVDVSALGADLYSIPGQNGFAAVKMSAHYV